MAEGTDQPNSWVYDILIWSFSAVLDLFFREIHPRSAWKIPQQGPVIFVAAPHANQFVDGILLMRTLRNEAKRRVSILTAASSMQRTFVGLWSRAFGCVPVGRALDNKKPAQGRIYLPDPENDPLLIRGVDTNFKGPDFQPGALIVLPSVGDSAASAEIAEIISPQELRLKKPLKGRSAQRLLTGRSGDKESRDPQAAQVFEKYRNDQGTLFLMAPKLDQSKVYSAVFDKLGGGGCVAIFPEGGSHDRTELLPLKAGVAIMALGALAENPGCNLKIVPCGMNYFHAHKFRSRAVIEFGSPLEVPQELVDEYQHGSRREAISKLLEMIFNSLVAVTVQTPNYETLMLIQAVRRLYNPKGKRLPLPLVVELNRRLVMGYERYKEDPRIKGLNNKVLKYNSDLFALNVRDHQLSYAQLSIFQVVGTLLYRITKLALLSIAVLPGLLLFSPIFILGKLISIKRSREALAASTVKIHARDVIATWKLLVALALAPTFNTVYTVLLTVWTHYSHVGGLVPEWFPPNGMLVVGFFLFPALCFAALRFGEIGMDILKSLRPLVLSLNPSSGNTLVKLRARREELVHEVAALINELGPEMFPDFEHQRIVNSDMTPVSPTSPQGRDWGEQLTSRSGEASPEEEKGWIRWPSVISPVSINIPRNESFSQFGNIGFFASRPQTPTESRSRSSSQGRPSSRGSFPAPNSPLTPLTPSNPTSGFDSMSSKIRSAMRERKRARESTSSAGLHGDAGSGTDSEDERGPMINGSSKKAA